jgi:hypothetical protein
MRKVLTRGIFGFLCLAVLFMWNADGVLANSEIEAGCLDCHFSGSAIVPDTKQFENGTPWHDFHKSESGGNCSLCHPGSPGSTPIETANCTTCHNTICPWPDFHTSNQTYNDNVTGLKCYQCHTGCAQPPGDADEDGIPDDQDNCPNHPNGPSQGTCTEAVGVNLIVSTGQFCTVDGDCDPGEFCEKTQADTYPPGGNGIGDACECEGNFDCDQDEDVDALDVAAFLADFGRSVFFNPCTNALTCDGDFLCDVDVDADDVAKFLEDFGRSPFFQPCPICSGAPWCSYP